MPFSVFHQITRLTTTSTIEVVPLRRNPTGIQILLLNRDDDDPVWPAQLHVPGTVIRPTDTLNSALHRVLEEELMGVDHSEPTFVKNIIHHSGRGLESSQIYRIDVFGKAKVGQFYDSINLPETIVQSQLDFIPAAIEDFTK